MSNNVSCLHQLPSMPWGLYGVSCEALKSNEKSKEHEKMTSLITISNIAGWIPVIGSLIGAIHTFCGGAAVMMAEDEEMAATGKMFIVRGIAEIFFLGPLLMIIDLVITIARKCMPEPHSNNLTSPSVLVV